MILEEIRPLLVAALIGLSALSFMRNRASRAPIRIPVRFEGRSVPQRIKVRRFDTESK